MTENPKTFAGLLPSMLRTGASLLLMHGSGMVHVGLSLIGEVGHVVHGRVIEISEVCGKLLPGAMLMLAATFPIAGLLTLVEASARKRIVAGFLAWTLLLLGSGSFLSTARGSTPATRTFYWICLAAGLVAGLIWTFSKSGASDDTGGSADAT